MHPIQLKNSIKRSLTKKGFSFIEVVTPCTTGYGRLRGLTPLDMMRALRDRGVIKKVHPTEATCDPTKEIILGDFVDIEKPTYNEVFETLTKRAGVTR
jgi:2-oxoglutarate/2-oxoacid ferredoxin oxidoreductase subunit beta